MRYFLPLVLITCLGCMPQAPQLNGQKSHIVAIQKRGTYEKQAWRYFKAADYSQALKMAYRATAVAPDAPGPALITGLIYDRVYDRPDLAIIEYDRLQRLAPSRPELEVLHLRLQHLFRRAQIKSASEAITSGVHSPLQEMPLAIAPFQVWANNGTHKALATGLGDLLAYDLENILGNDHFPVLRLHALRHVFGQTNPEATGKDFAKWAGAMHTLVGEVAPQNEQVVVVSTQLINATGETVYALPRLTVGPEDIPHFRRVVLSEMASYLKFDLPASFEPQPATSLVALRLHAQGLNAYLSNDLSRASYFFNGALALENDAPLFVDRLNWVKEDLQGAQYTNELPKLYQQLYTRPLPKIALERRLQTSQAFLAPNQGIEGSEALSPYKPPQSGGTP